MCKDIWDYTDSELLQHLKARKLSWGVLRRIATEVLNLSEETLSERPKDERDLLAWKAWANQK